MIRVSVAEAADQLDELIDKVLNGERVIIVSDDNSAVELLAHPEAIQAAGNAEVRRR